MTAISLRDYNQEISKLIDRGFTDEASDHCRFILIKYPKTLETYKLLGKAYLESNRYQEAGDIFLRVLAVTPDDYLAHAGMSIIREKNGNLLAAIWHMERAFECQPGNTAIQAELRGLYGKRDGTQPEKVRLTRGALCRMYARGNQYRQAIAEVRAVLATTPDRYDLEVLLAELLAATDQKDECKNICLRILQKYPYCQSCNQLMLKLSTPGSSDASKFDLRLAEINPYHEYISANYPEADSVPADSIMLDKLEYLTPTDLSIDTVLDHEHFEEAPMLDDSTDMDDTQPILIEKPDSPVEDIEIPEWLETEEIESTDPSSGDVMPATSDELISDSVPSDMDSEILPTIPDIPAWEREESPLSAEASQENQTLKSEMAEEPVPGTIRADEADETPEWLRNLFMDDTPASNSPMWNTPAPDEYIPEKPAEGATYVDTSTSDETIADITGKVDNDIPEWLNELDSIESAESPEEVVEESEGDKPVVNLPDIGIPEESMQEKTSSSGSISSVGKDNDEFEIPEWLKNIHDNESLGDPEVEAAQAAETQPTDATELATRISELTDLYRSGTDPISTIQQVDELLSQYSDNSTLWLLAGDLRKETGNLSGAIEAYTKAESILKSSQNN